MSLLSSLRRLKARLHGRTDSEHEQAILRIVIVALVLAYMLWHFGPQQLESDRSTLVLVAVLAADLLFAFGVFIAICIWPAKNVPRRLAGMVADATTATLVVLLTNEAGVGMVGVYLFITFGNGFRYGRRYLFACQTLCLIGFAGALLFAPYWQLHQVAGWNLFVALVVLPLYVSTLLTRIQEARAKAEEANRAKSTFLANMSHEMRTPLNGIVGVVDLINVTRLDPQQSELIRLLRHSVGVMRSLVDDVLDITKIEAGRLTIEVTDFDLHALFNGLVKLLRPHAQAKGLRLYALVDPSIEYHLRGDPHHLRQILLNLATNAIKFTEQGEIAISVGLVAESGSAVRLRFEVRDTGIGIDAQAQARIFERFVQADQSTTRRYGGTGLGTTIAKQLVELMSGTIGVKSTVGAGSSFWFEVPFTVAAAAEPRSDVAGCAALLMADDATASRVAPLAAEACGGVETVATTAGLISRVRSLVRNGMRIPAVIVAGEAGVASEVFGAVAAERGDQSIAMIYVAGDAKAQASGDSVFAAREDVTRISLDAPARVLRNAIHAAAAQDGDSQTIIDLGQVLAEQRVPRRILVAEDNATNRAIIGQLLTSAGHTVLMAQDGEEALDIYEAEDPELAILDFNMPLRNGIDVTMAVRNMEAPGAHLPIVILSASVTPESRERARRAGADDFVGKPYDGATLLQVIDRLARRASRGFVRQPAAVPANVTPLAPLVDRRRLADVERIASDERFMQQLLAGYRSDVVRLMDLLEVLVVDGRHDEVQEVTHAIKGAASSVGAAQLAMRCDLVEQAAAVGDGARLRSLLVELTDCVKSTEADLAAYASERRPVSVTPNV